MTSVFTFPQLAILQHYFVMFTNFCTISFMHNSCIYVYQGQKVHLFRPSLSFLQRCQC
jgi:hypothetical protein